ncbi:hypothetical protein [Paraburkholderia ferrariae]|uniref:hypothetical protein n=1 Tax=Paraburkholderia ferrariae TaxID=386056 RepID=UPI00047F041E|nr:hypothetical protein [Paraburkholderia ferrariae]
MSGIPTTVTSTPENFTPAFKRIQQEGEADCPFACIAMIAGKTLDEVRAVAVERFKFPAHPPRWITEDLICSLAANYQLVATVYKEFRSFSELPPLAILLVEYIEELEMGRHVLYHRGRASHDPKVNVQYVMDPAYWIKPQDHVRTALPPTAYFIGIHAMQQKAGAGK